MENLKTTVFWSLNDYCRSECEYCPVQLRGGGLPHETKDYLRVINTLIDAYTRIGRSIDWVIDGGEPLDMDDIVTILKLCRTNGNSLTLNTNGGKLWMDWWAIEPYVDKLHLTFHYWQNPALMKYIIDTFREKGKDISVTAPIRPGYNFRSDITRATDLESQCNFYITKTLLYKDASQVAGLFPYTHEELNKIHFWNFPFDKRIPKTSTPSTEPEYSALARNKIKFDSMSWDERYEEKYNSNPVFTGKQCNASVEKLYISHLGWVSGSSCSNRSLGNIWQDGWVPSIEPQICTMRACVNESDQQITKFP